jgi:hypothetical protein
MNCLTQAAYAQQKQEPRLSHGTVNILLANSNGLVAVTDSMLTVSGRFAEHNPTGTKLFKLDDRTVCTMAGEYRTPGPNSRSSLELLVPQVMNDFATELRTKRNSNLAFERKAQRLSALFERRMTINLQFLATANEDISKIQDLYLTIAGYDIDGQLKIAEITFRPTKNQDGVFYIPAVRPPSELLPACEVSAGVDPQSDYLRLGQPSLKIRTVRQHLFCEVVGLAHVAEDLLKNPDRHRDLPAIAMYLDADLQNRSLSIDEMRVLALELERQTARAEDANGRRWVGGEPQVATLSAGKVVDFVSNPIAEEPKTGTGTGLDLTRVYQTTMTCQSPEMQHFAVGDPKRMNGQMSAKLINCGQTLDGFLFHDSTFIDSRIVYLGIGELAFADTNVVQGSTLVLGSNVDLKRPDVHHLICGFDWKTIEGGGAIREHCGEDREK